MFISDRTSIHSAKHVEVAALPSPDLSLLAASQKQELHVSTCDMLTQRNNEVALLLRRAQQPSRVGPQDS